MKKLSELLFIISALKKFYLAKTQDSFILKQNQEADKKDKPIPGLSLIEMIKTKKNIIQNNRVFKFTSLQILKLYFMNQISCLRKTKKDNLWKTYSKGKKMIIKDLDIVRLIKS